jgi:hypothetical protein
VDAQRAAIALVEKLRLSDPDVISDTREAPTFLLIVVDVPPKLSGAFRKHLAFLGSEALAVHGSGRFTSWDRSQEFAGFGYEKCGIPGRECAYPPRRNTTLISCLMNLKTTA